MLSFPSSLNRSGNGAQVTSSSGNYPLTPTTESLFDTSRMKAFNFSLNRDVAAELMDPNAMDISTFMEYTGNTELQAPWTVLQFNATNAQDMKTLINWVQDSNRADTSGGNVGNQSGQTNPTNTNKSLSTLVSYDKDTKYNAKTQPFFEDAFKLPSGLIDSMNRYTHVYKTPVNSVLNMGSEKNLSLQNDKKVSALGKDIVTTYSPDAGRRDVTLPDDQVQTAMNLNTKNANIYINYAQTPVVSSIFNPIYMIQVMGMTENVPLLSNIYDISKDITIEYDQSVPAKNNPNKDKDGAKQGGLKLKINPLNNIVDTNLSNCTMRELVRKSHKHNSILGQARYKYADFMFCKDLGKVSNNHLITLRKFAHPIGDNIFRLTSPKFRTKTPGDAPDYDAEGDVGRLVTWFGTDDNKLEDLSKFTVGASWKELEATIQALGENQDSANKSVDQINSAAGGMGGLQTSNVDVTSGIEVIIPKAPKMSAFNQQLIYAPMGVRLMTQSTKNMTAKEAIAENLETAQTTYGSFNYGSDKNKIYTPKNTIQATHVYEGKLTYEQEFNLNFSYKLRAYDNINPKSAFLDLLGNILEVTYRRGKFWGGARSAQGPKDPAGGGSPGGGGGGGSHGGGSGPAKNENVADDNWDMLEGLCRGLASGAIDWQSIMAKISDLVNNISDTAKEMAQQIKDGWNANGILGAIGQGILTFRNALSLLGDGLGGGEDAQGGSGSGGAGGGPGRGGGSHAAKNAGKPAMYAMDSLLKGDSVGLWHLTVGNPKNPIFVCGNLILTKATVNFSGPLGIDDFPTDLKVTCTLKHGRARDIIEISKMFTKGTNTLYNTVDRNRLSDFFSVAKTTVESRKNEKNAISTLLTEYEANKKMLEQADTKEVKAMITKSAKEEWEKRESAWKEQQEAQGNKDVKERKWNDSYQKETNAWVNFQNSLEAVRNRNRELEGLLTQMQTKYSERDENQTDFTNKNGTFSLSMPSSIYDNQLYDKDIYNDDEFTDETGTEYITSPKALRYETLGQDRDYIGRMVIDEVS